MMRLLKICSFCLFSALPGAHIFAQTYTLFPGDTMMQQGSMEDLHILGIRQNNNLQDTLFLKWRKLSADLPDKWEAANCDNVFCNTMLADSGAMNPVYPSSFGFLEMHITPKINHGTAVIRYLVWDLNNPQNADTLTYILKVNPLALSDLTADPLPGIWNAAGKLYVTDPFQFKELRLLDIQGHEIFKLTEISQLIELPEIVPGIYILSATDAQKQTRFKKICHELQ